MSEILPSHIIYFKKTDMNFDDFIITASLAFVSGVGLGLIIKDLWCFIIKAVRILSGKPEIIQPVKFSKFFKSRED